MSSAPEQERDILLEVCFQELFAEEADIIAKYPGSFAKGFANELKKAASSCFSVGRDTHRSTRMDVEGHEVSFGVGTENDHPTTDSKILSYLGSGCTRSFKRHVSIYIPGLSRDGVEVLTETEEFAQNLALELGTLTQNFFEAKNQVLISYPIVKCAIRYNRDTSTPVTFAFCNTEL